MGSGDKELQKRLNEVNGDDEIRKLIKEITKRLKKDPADTSLLEHRAMLYTKVQLFGQAINDYRMIQQIDKDHPRAGMQIEQLRMILRFQNTDIFENPNTTFDPWLE
jgi:regulator of sirC expression with transglutaminase-like and TPR domain